MALFPAEGAFFYEIIHDPDELAGADAQLGGTFFQGDGKAAVSAVFQKKGCGPLTAGNGGGQSFVILQNQAIGQQAAEILQKYYVIEKLASMFRQGNSKHQSVTDGTHVIGRILFPEGADFSKDRKRTYGTEIDRSSGLGSGTEAQFAAHEEIEIGRRGSGPDQNIAAGKGP